MSEALVAGLLHALGAGDVPESRVPSVLALDALPPAEAEGVLRLLAHDLKSPSGDIVSALSLLREIPESQGGQMGRRMVRSALDAARWQLALVDELLNLLALEGDMLVPAIDTVDIRALLGEVLAEGESAIAQKGLNVVNQVPDGSPSAEADGSLLRQVMRTLLYNSLKFCVQGDTLALRLCRAGGRFVALVFIDTGRPVLLPFAGTLFDMAAQWRARQAGSRSSVGVGLPFCRAAVRAMGGRIVGRSSEDGAQTGFAVALRLVEKNL